MVVLVVIGVTLLVCYAKQYTLCEQRSPKRRPTTPFSKDATVVHLPMLGGGGGGKQY